MPVASPPGDPGGTFFFRRRPAYRLPKKFLLHIVAALSLWGIFIGTVPPFNRGSVAASIGALLGFSFGCALTAYALGAFFLAGRRRANPTLMSVSEFLSGLGDVERRRWIAEGYRWPRLRGFARNVLRGGTFLLYHIALYAGGSAALGLLTVAVLRAFGVRVP